VKLQKMLLRLSRVMTVSEIAKIVGVSTATICRLKNDANASTHRETGQKIRELDREHRR